MATHQQKVIKNKGGDRRMKILYPIRAFVIETNDKKYIHVKEGDFIRFWVDRNEPREGIFKSINTESIEIDCSEKFKSHISNMKIEYIINIEVIKENDYEGNYVK